MKKLFIVANWKSNKDSIQTKNWIEGFKNYDLRFTNKEIVICPSFVHLPILKSYIINPPAGEAGHKSEIKLGAQDISPFDEGAYTGEINGKQIKEFADYVLIGHSERRKNFGETDEVINQKIEMAIKYNLMPILCISDINQVQSSTIRQAQDKVQSGNSKLIIAYEPIFAIGTGQPDTPENADKTAREIKSELNDVSVLYGGSVTEENVNTFTKMQNIDGVLVGASSLDVSKFCKIIEFSEPSSLIPND